MKVQDFLKKKKKQEMPKLHRSQIDRKEVESLRKRMAGRPTDLHGCILSDSR